MLSCWGSLVWLIYFYIGIVSLIIFPDVCFYVIQFIWLLLRKKTLKRTKMCERRLRVVFSKPFQQASMQLIYVLSHFSSFFIIRKICKPAYLPSENVCKSDLIVSFSKYLVLYLQDTILFILRGSESQKKNTKYSYI